MPIPAMQKVMRMSNLGRLVFDVIFGIGGSIYVIYYTSQYLFKGKIRSINVFAYSIYSFKKEPLKAYLTLIINIIAFLLLFCGGIISLLLYFNIIN